MAATRARPLSPADERLAAMAALFAGARAAALVAGLGDAPAELGARCSLLLSAPRADRLGALAAAAAPLPLPELRARAAALARQAGPALARALRIAGGLEAGPAPGPGSPLLRRLLRELLGP